MTEDQGKPAIRFKGFTDAWEQRKLGDTVQITMGQSPDGSTYSDVPSDYILVQGNADLQNGWVTPRVWTTQVTKKAEAGDLIMSVRAPAGAMGKTAYNAVIGRGVVAIKGNEFIYQLLVKMNSNGYWKVLSCGSTFESLNSDNIKNAEVIVPKQDEQVAIGHYFRNFDNLITLHQREYDKTVNLKKAMLEKMFPKNGEDRPEIRFRGFTDAWEQRKFSELYVKTVKKNDFTYGKEDIISVANMYYKPDSYISDRNYLLTYNVFELGDIAFEGNKSKNYAHGRFVENTIGDGIVSHVFDTFKPIVPEHDLLYWKYAINNENIMGKVLVKSTKSSTMMTNLVSDDFLKESILVPSYKEQKQIGSILYQMENLITLHQRELKKLQNMKKALLEKMFVQG
ncbi:MAG: restriction endonuclease subunit S [Candidatus Methanomethylophilaceae archaeon]|nr:restriction endonuclease subunit S [Candidatus Methanomethylophilaceae archaeon]